MRAAFEAWLNPGNHAGNVSAWVAPGRYEKETHQAMWLGWCAASERAGADASRYRWLRDVSVPPHNFYLSVPVEFDGVKYSRAEVDAYIDAVIARSQG